MNALDWGITVVWLGVALSGFWKGAVRIVFGVGGLAIGLWLAVVVGHDLAVWCGRTVTEPWAAILGRLLPVVGSVALFGLAGWGIGRTLEALHLGWLNRLAGAALAAAVGAVLLGALLIVAVRFSPAWAELSRGSLIAPYLLRLVELLFG